MKLKIAIALALACVSFVHRLDAQDPTGVLEGQVLDASGGLLPNIPVTLTNIHTGYRRAESTSASGMFRFGLLPVGQYSLKVTAPMFAEFTQGPIEILVSQTARLNVQLQLASVTQSVTVTEDANPVDTATDTPGEDSQR